jgi:tetratricopeptide (TPR) repeat protein
VTVLRRKPYRILTGVLLSTSLAVAQQQAKNLQQILQSAQAAYSAGHASQAASQLETVLPGPSDPALQNLNPEYSSLVELLGLCYASLSQDARAIPYLEVASRLQPASKEAHTNLAAGLLRLGRTAQALPEFQVALTLAPQDYSANHNLGEFYIQAGSIADAIPLLEKAQSLKSDAYDNGYDLATADLMLGRFSPAHQVVQSLLRQKNTGELHDLEAQIDEKEGKYVEAVNEFEAAAHLDPSEANLFDWGSELLLHRTYDPAIEVFRAAAQRYPRSPRIMIGLGISLYARGLYDDAVTALLAGADLDPKEPRCYLFLSKAYYSQQSHTEEVVERFRRYAEATPNSAAAQYYYAMSLLKGRSVAGGQIDMQQVEALLQRSIAMDDKFADARFELGNLYSSRHDYEKAMEQYRSVIELNPGLADAHYRLATVYTHLGNKEQAQAELNLYQKLRADHLAASDKEGNELQQFVYSSKALAATP